MKKQLLFILSIILIGTSLMAQSSPAKVLIEEHTGAWCGYCPDGHVILDQLLANNPTNTIGVMVHNGDGMDFGYGNSLSAFYVTGFPQGTINRRSAAISRNLWVSTTASILAQGPTSVTVSFDSVLYNPSLRKLNVYMKAYFTGNEAGDIRFNGILVEDAITGTGPNYDQSNYFNTTSNHPMYGLGNPIVGYVHDKVARTYFGGPFGTLNSLPTTITAGSTYIKHYTFTVPATYDDTELSVIGMVSRVAGATADDREIINSEVTDAITIINYAVGMEEDEATFNAIYPNPTQGIVNITPAVSGKQQLSVTNILGELVMSKEVNLVSGSPFSIDITAQPVGIYLLRIGNSSERIIKE